MRREPDVKDLNYQLGMYVGEHITLKYLPTLSTDSVKSYVEIEVSEEDTERHEQVHNALKDAWDKRESSEEAFNIYKALNNELARKYLSEKLECMVPKIYPTNMDKFKEGLKDQLWNTDLSHYWPEDDFYRQGHELGWADYIVLTLKIN